MMKNKVRIRKKDLEKNAKVKAEVPPVRAENVNELPKIKSSDGVFGETAENRNLI